MKQQGAVEAHELVYGDETSSEAKTRKGYRKPRAANHEEFR